MSRSYSQGFYTLINPEKYIGSGTPKYRSGWELTFMRFCDNHPSVINWASENVRIPYKNPFTGRDTFYVPDFFVVYQNGRGRQAELIEIKPKSQSLIEEKQSQRDRAQVAINYAKWDQATKWAKKNGLSFRVINEDQIFRNGAK